jgi:hypothetical protein
MQYLLMDFKRLNLVEEIALTTQQWINKQLRFACKRKSIYSFLFLLKKEKDNWIFNLRNLII